jgi:hypothetical protein
MEGASIALIVLFCSGILYEMGQLSGTSIKEYLKDPWNKLDIYTYLCLIVWAATQLSNWHNIHKNKGYIGESYLKGGLICLSISAIIISFRILQHVSVSQKLGQLVLIIIATLEDIISFLYVFCFCVLGFLITLMTLGSSSGRATAGFENIGSGILVLFTVLMGGISFEPFGADSELSSVAATVLLIFCCLTAIVLMNLLIARMSGTYDDIHAKALAEWTFNQVRSRAAQYFYIYILISLFA